MNILLMLIVELFGVTLHICFVSFLICKAVRDLGILL